jgi:hypothetical protein
MGSGGDTYLSSVGDAGCGDGAGNLVISVWFPHRSYPFSRNERGRVFVFSLCPFQKIYSYKLNNFNTFLKTYYMLSSNYYKMYYTF